MKRRLHNATEAAAPRSLSTRLGPRSAARSSTAAGSPSPYVIGAAIGLLNIAAFAAFRQGIGVSGAYESSAALLAREVAPDALHVNRFVQARDTPPKVNWESFLVAGTILGGYLMARADRRGDAGGTVDDAPPLRSPLQSAAGGALLMYGARMAGGCTSGHGLTGTAQGATSSWVFTPLMFLVGSLVARARRARKGVR